MVTQSSPEAEQVPVLRVARGEPSAAELAAVVVVLRARAGRPAASRPERPSRWAARDRLVRLPPPAGPGAWRASALPR
jgi:hypothetical protein